MERGHTATIGKGPQYAQLVAQVFQLGPHIGAVFLGEQESQLGLDLGLLFEEGFDGRVERRRVVGRGRRSAVGAGLGWRGFGRHGYKKEMRQKAQNLSGGRGGRKRVVVARLGEAVTDP